jgi:hypothetical protein
MKMANLIAVAGLVLVSTTASAQQIQTPPTDRAEKKICKTDRTTGSLTRRTRVCLTQREWDQAADISRKGVDALKQDGHQATLEREIAPLPGGGGW